MKYTFIGLRTKLKEKREIKALAKKRDFRTISSFIFWLIAQAKKGLILLCLFIIGCASVNYLPSGQNQYLPSTQSVQVLYEKPQKSYTELGLIICEGDMVSNEALFKKLKQKAMRIGADAIIIRDTEISSDLYGGSFRKIEGLAIKWKE